MNTKNLGPTRYIIQSVILALVVLIFLVCVVFDSFLQTEPLQNEKNIFLDSGWTIRIDGKTLAENQTLPYLIKGELVGKTCEASPYASP
ncbi:hypothetical protein [uncultured Sphaerochaeta sp.]|uniref:hypothetical protein n=1 Tax=uncultured Sphaerochaeta sp. TaxID=886478 RepID=UPI002A0A3042|nr:hypothetical protein [uncultured Sphaerochaeta sp.]